MSRIDPSITEGPGPLSDRLECCVLLVGHGSHLSPASARPVHELARRLRARGSFGEVRVAFWKEEPQLHQAFHLVERSEVFVVPVFTSTGYFTDRVVPRELALDRTLVARPDLRIRECPAVGTHPRMSQVVMERAREAASLSAEEEAGATLVVAGHGTNRHPDSGRTTRAIVEALRREGSYGSVIPAFLDQEPRLAEVLDGERVRNVIVVPFFIAEGWHAGTTIPDDLALTGGRTRRGETTIWYGKPVGPHPAMVEVVLQLVEQEARREARPETPGAGRDSSSSPPVSARAREAFGEWLRSAGPQGRSFLETLVRPGEEGCFEIRHHLDRERSRSELRRVETPDGAVGLGATTETGDHRPVRTAPGLRRGWRFSGLDEAEVWEVYAHLYPVAPVHWYLGRTGGLSPRSFEEVARRQTGIYAGLEGMSDSELERLTQTVCAADRCLRTPVWRPSFGVPARPSQGVPCPEPCSLFISEAREHT